MRRKDSPHDVTQGISSFEESTSESERSHEHKLGASWSDRGELPGYSSGASSVASIESDDEEVLEHDRVGLEDIRSSLQSGTGGRCNVRMETVLGKPVEEYYDGVHDGRVLGSGVSGIVREVKHKITGVHYAVKILDLGLVTSQEGLEHLRDEILIMCQLDYPGIMQLVEAFESENTIYLIQHICTGGDLFDRLDEQPDFHYTEADACRLVKQMLSSVRYLHSRKIIHRDLKLENFLFSTSEADSELKMIDFGLRYVQNLCLYRFLLYVQSVLLNCHVLIPPSHSYFCQ